jgi:UDP-N-acetylglucosamine--N-acetylmuramyl-(pentapeptide) pyrophosphoryl-undecaprenol N-acetylglucosamine transferase
MSLSEDRKTAPSSTILLAAGGTGGHLFPAESLARELQKRGCSVALVSDDRVADFASTFPAKTIHQVTSGTVTGAGIAAKVGGALALARGVWQCRALLKRIKPSVVVGFGGYPTVPPLLAATMLKIPTVLHEQNAVMGRANRFLSARVNRIATGFDLKDGRTVQVGNPVREAVLEAARLDMPLSLPGGPLRLVVFGGSQGARIMGETVPHAVARLAPELRRRLHITQQVREEDLPRVQSEYAALGVKADCAAFFRDLPIRMAQSHLIIARSGASTVAELAVIGRPSILVPLPGSLDQDQAANAAMLANQGAAEIMLQPAFTPDALANRLSRLMDAPEILMETARKAKALGIADAASRLADVVLKVAGRENPVKAT